MVDTLTSRDPTVASKYFILHFIDSISAKIALKVLTSMFGGVSPSIDIVPIREDTKLKKETR